MADNNSSFFDAVHWMHANWNPVKDCHDLGLPAVYVRDNKVVWQFPGGEISSDIDAGDRALSILNSAAKGEQADMARRIRTRYEALTGQDSEGATSVDWDAIMDEIGMEELDAGLSTDLDTVITRAHKIVDQAISNQRLAGLPSDPATVAMTAKVAAGLVSDEELQAWVDERIAEIKRDEK